MTANRLALDTNLLVLWVVGQVSRQLIGRHRRLRKYSEEDFDVLIRTLSKYQHVVVTPNASTETSNLVVSGLGDPFRTQVLATLGLILKGSAEIYEPSASVTSGDDYLRLGLTDATWLKVLDRLTLLLTDDTGLYLAACRSGIEAYHFRNARNSGILA